jgi:hypothetical protein
MRPLGLELEAWPVNVSALSQCEALRLPSGLRLRFYLSLPSLSQSFNLPSDDPRFLIFTPGTMAPEGKPESLIPNRPGNRHRIPLPYSLNRRYRR